MNKPRIADIIAHKMESMILEGVLKPGEKLPAERKLADKFEVSRPTLREAINKLTAKGLLRTHQGGGNYVCESLAPSLTDPLLEIFRERPNTRFDVLEVRHALEGQAAYYAAMRCTEVDKQIIQERYQAMLETHGGPDPRAEAKADTEFHMAIAEAADNVVLLHVMRGLFTLLLDSISFSHDKLYTKPGVFKKLKNQHHALMTAVVDGEPDKARQAAHDHLVYIEKTLQEIDKEEARKERALRRLTPFTN
ncbi:MAG: FCD domain-containing protein [Gammaproteobacteria bacterium]|nr:FCD domain-containing protein [Gammaproteobacteria bacterium]